MSGRVVDWFLLTKPVGPPPPPSMQVTPFNGIGSTAFTPPPQRTCLAAVLAECGIQARNPADHSRLLLTAPEHFIITVRFTAASCRGRWSSTLCQIFLSPFPTPMVARLRVPFSPASRRCLTAIFLRRIDTTRKSTWPVRQVLRELPLYALPPQPILSIRLLLPIPLLHRHRSHRTLTLRLN